MQPTVGDVMTTDVLVVRPDTPFKEIVRRLRERGVGAVPVVDDQRRVRGVISETGLALKEERRPGEPGPVLGLERPAHRRERRKAAALTAADCMSSPAVAIGPQATARAAARLLHRRGIHHLPVTDDDGCLLGIVSRRDLLRAQR